MTQKVEVLVCQDCAKEKTNWTEHCPHAMEVWKNGYNRALRERPRPRLTSEDVSRAISDLSSSWKNFYHLAADALNRILDEKEKKP
jgi:predicted ATP-dependent serine protease